MIFICYYSQDLLPAIFFGERTENKPVNLVCARARVSLSSYLSLSFPDFKIGISRIEASIQPMHGVGQR